MSPQGFGDRLGCPLGTGVGRRLGLFSWYKKERDFVVSLQCAFLTQHLHQCCRARSPEPSSFHPLEHLDHHLHLLSGVLWSLSCAHPHGALVPDSPREPLAAGFFPCWVGPCQICCGCWHPLCSFIQVSAKTLSQYTAKLKSILALRIERQEGTV